MDSAGFQSVFMEMSNGHPSDGAARGSGVRVAEWLGFSLVVAIVLALAFPVYVPLSYRVPGFQALTPNKILLPLLVPVVAALALNRQARRRWLNPVTGAFGVLIAWALTSAAFNETGNLVLNFKNLIWLVLAFALHLVVVATVTTRGRTGILVGAFAALACVLSVLGFVEIHTYNSWDRFFMLFRPQLIAGDVVGNGPDILLPLHNYYGTRRILQSTIGSSTAFALLATLLFGAVGEAFDRGKRRSRRRTWLLLVSFWLVASATWFTYSRSAALQLASGVATGLLLATWARRRIPWATVFATVAVAAVVLAVDPESVRVVAGKFDSTRYGWAELRRVESAPPTVKSAEPPPAAAAQPPATSAPVAAPSASAPGAPAPAAPSSPPPAPAPTGSFSVAQRLILARIAVDMAIRYPVFGVGPLNFRPLLYGDPYYKSMFRLGVAEVFDAHSFYLTMLATLGVAGLLLLLVLLFFVVRQLASGFGPSGWTSGALTVASLWAAFLVGGFFGFSLLDPVSDIIFAFLVSAVLVVCPFGGERSGVRHDGQDVRAG